MKKKTEKWRRIWSDSLTLPHSSEQTQTHVACAIVKRCCRHRRPWLRWWRYRRWQTPDVEEEETGGNAVNLPFFIFVFHSGNWCAACCVVHAPFVVLSHSVSLPLSRRESVRRICTHLAQVLRFSCLLSVVRQPVRRLWFECRYTYTHKHTQNFGKRQKLTHENSEHNSQTYSALCMLHRHRHRHTIIFAILRAQRAAQQIRFVYSWMERSAVEWTVGCRLFLVRCSMKSMKSLSHLLFMFARYVIPRRCLDTGYIFGTN